MLQEIITTVGEALAGAISWIKSAFEAAVAVIYTPASGTVGQAGYVAGGLTPVGILLLISVGVTFAFFGIRTLMSLPKKVG